MEQERTGNNNLVHFLSHLNTYNTQMIIAYLDHQTIIRIMSVVKQQTHHFNQFIQLICVRYFFQSYLTKTDRSLYVSFYSEKKFIDIEQQQISIISKQSSASICSLSHGFSKLFEQLRAQISSFPQANDVVNSLIESLTDPQLPFPKLRKQNIGIHCNSAFQFFLIDKLFTSNDYGMMQETFEELNIFLGEQWQELIEAQTNHNDIYAWVLKDWFKITYQNYENYLIVENKNHNLVIILIALLDLIIDSFNFYIDSIEDSLHSFVEFNIRYCIFRNIVLSLEEKIGFLFKSYFTFCKETQNIDSGEIRQITVWHVALSKWYLHMQRHHDRYFQIYFYLLKKINLKTIQEQNQSLIESDQAFISIKNCLELQSIDILERQDCFQFYSPLQEFFQGDSSLYSQIIKEHTEYLVDISINENSVHWCGHSEHVMHIPYQHFEDSFLAEFKTYLEKMLEVAKGVRQTAAFDKMLRSLIQQLDRQFLKPVTLKKILLIIEEQVSMVFGREKFEKTQIFGYITSLRLYFEVEDKRLQVFNNQNDISNEINYSSSIVLDNQDYNSLLKASLSTNNSTKMRIGSSLRAKDSIFQEDFP